MKLYYEKKIGNAKSNMKSTWRVLTKIMNRKTQTNKLPSTFKIDNREISNPKEIANRFCEYFTNVGPHLVKNIPPSANSHQSYLKGNFVDSLFFLFGVTTRNNRPRELFTLRNCNYFLCFLIHVPCWSYSEVLEFHNFQILFLGDMILFH